MPGNLQNLPFRAWGRAVVSEAAVMGWVTSLAAQPSRNFRTRPRPTPSSALFLLLFFFSFGPFLKSLLNFATILLLFYVLVFWP